mmetsp:Transcript_27821/g.46280  ORF Transcript_27821/g.46280 Transcript_27821/m.46280 type:complete len:248 (+) Transcript_27821:2294-3037(+)
MRNEDAVACVLRRFPHGQARHLRILFQVDGACVEWHKVRPAIDRLVISDARNLVVLPRQQLIVCARVDENPFLVTTQQAVDDVCLVVMNLRRCISVGDPKTHLIDRCHPWHGLDRTIRRLDAVVFRVFDAPAQHERRQLQVKRHRIGHIGDGIDVIPHLALVDKLRELHASLLGTCSAIFIGALSAHCQPTECLIQVLKRPLAHGWHSQASTTHNEGFPPLHIISPKLTGSWHVRGIFDRSCHAPCT